MKSLKEQLYDFLAENGETHGGELERFGMSLGYMAGNVGRRLRELRNEGLVKSVKRKGEKSKVATCWWQITETLNLYNIESILEQTNKLRPEVLQVKSQPKLL